MRKLGTATDNDPIFYADSMKYETGEFWKSPRTGKLFVITLVDDEKIDTPDGLQFRYQMRDATENEIAELAEAQKEWDALTPAQRTEEIFSQLQEQFPGLDW